MKLIDVRMKTIERLVRDGIPMTIAEDLVDSYYAYYGQKVESHSGDTIGNDDLILIDMYYGVYERYKNIVNYYDKDLLPPVRTVWVSSLKEAQDAIADFTKNWNKNRFLTFRGMNREYFLNRKYKNPLSPKIDGKEPSLLPSYWRNHDNDEDAILEEQFFRTSFAEELIYNGIDVAELAKRNTEKYGIHSISDLEDDDDPISQEYYKRWQAKTYDLGEAALLAQHYGFCTRDLDITFDLAVGSFFAAYKFIMKENGKATYKPNINKEAAVYCFDFGHSIRKENEFSSSRLFAHAFPERPKRQKCVGYGAGFMEFNEPAGHIVYRLKLNDDFDIAELPKPEELFPSRQEDAFYDLLLQYKEKYKDFEFAKCIVEYEFND